MERARVIGPWLSFGFVQSAFLTITGAARRSCSPNAATSWDR